MKYYGTGAVMILYFRCASIVVALATMASAVEPGQPSKTSISIAALRAIGAKNPDAALRNPDYLAIKFIGPKERAIIADELPVDTLELEFAEAMTRVRVPPLVSAMVARTKYVDTELLKLLEEGVRQVVILGAGFDTRGLRFRDRFSGVKFFEVDYGPTQEYKKRRTREIYGSLPRHIRYVPMDFTKDDLLTQLRQATYSDRERTFFIWEGVVMYIPEAAVKQTLRFVRDRSGRGSTIIFNYPLSAHPDINNPKTNAAQSGEPWVFGFPGDSAADFVRSEGLDVVADVAASELVRRYAVRGDGTSNLPVQPPPAARDMRYCIARVPTN